ncbi:hypothetical protein J2X54_003908 [Duganella sp. 3397]|uniref:Flagellin n=1 Tax=Duganella phyllosphaerae TaxID=762836 RepID=A0A1E7X5V5_9BURK|nr:MULTISPECIES: hypothetical protein [Duganella]MDR7051421.1 hypothetical protein [Duganella sp. 3397]OFA08032.1 hypothetical protein DUPY_09380 [Duganella phyllosphaerae]
MQIPSPSTPPVIVAGNGGNASAVDGTALGLNGEKAATATPVNPTPTAAAPLRRGLNNWDQPLQRDISGAQQALDFLEQSAGQLRSLKADLSARLANRQRADGNLESNVRQFGNTWRSRSVASGGTLDSQLNFSNENTRTRFTVRGMNVANLRQGGREVLALSLGGQNLRSVVLEPGMNDQQIALRFDDALAPAGVRVKLAEDGQLEFSAAENEFAAIRDSLAVQGNGQRFPAGQLNRLRAEPETPVIEPDTWQTSDAEGLRATLQQVLQALAQVEKSIASVRSALGQANARVSSTAPNISTEGMELVADKFVDTAQQPGYQSLLSITSALSGISRERVVSLLRLR